MAYAESHLPMLFNIIEGKSLGAVMPVQEPSIAAFINSEGALLGPENVNDQQTVAVINIKSPIYKYDQDCGPQGTQSKIRTLEALKNNDAIVGVVLDVDSGGGQAFGTPEFYDYLKSYPKPVVTYTGGMLCSAAYYLGSAASHIVANKRAEAIGSIGAYTQMLDLSGFYEKQGIKIHTIYAEKSTEKNKAYRDALSGDYKSYIKEELNPLVEYFISDIQAVRPGVNEKVFKGATYSGPKALKMGLVDSLGSLQDAVQKAFELSNSKSINTQTQMTKPNSYPNLETVLGVSEPLATTDNGSFLNEEQKEALENSLATAATAVQTAQAAQEEAETALEAATQAHAEALTAEASNVTATTSQLRAAANLAGVENLPEDASAEVIATALNAQIETLNGKPGAGHTTGADAGNNVDPTPKYADKEAYRKMYKN